MKERIAELVKRVGKLIDVKSIVTLFLTIVFGVLVLKSVVVPDELKSILMLIYGFYFAAQTNKGVISDEEKR